MITPEDKEVTRSIAHSDGFSFGIDYGRRLADEMDAMIYTRTDLIGVEAIYFSSYVRGFAQGLLTAFKRRCNESVAFRYDIYRDKLRKEKRDAKVQNS